MLLQNFSICNRIFSVFCVEKVKIYIEEMKYLNFMAGRGTHYRKLFKFSSWETRRIVVFTGTVIHLNSMALKIPENVLFSFH